jgi:hypothetical protein
MSLQQIGSPVSSNSPALSISLAPEAGILQPGLGFQAPDFDRSQGGSGAPHLGQHGIFCFGCITQVKLQFKH